MSSTYKLRFYDQQKQNDIRFNQTGPTKLLAICLDYKQGSDQNPLTCIIDGQRIIQEAQKFQGNEYTTLFDDGSGDYYPSYENVSNQMIEIAQSCQQGDFLVIFYSGHGGNVQDQDGDQKDGNDEALCLRNQQTGQTQFMTDDQIAAIISQNLPNNVPCLFIIDACHSGTILDLTSKSWKGKKVFSISGCQDDQYSNDTGDGGQMTNALLKILQDNQEWRGEGSCSIQYIFNSLIVENIETNIQDENQRAKAYQQVGFGENQTGKKSKKPKKLNKFGNAKGFYEEENYEEFQQYQEESENRQLFTLSWNGGSDPTRVPFPI